MKAKWTPERKALLASLYPDNDTALVAAVLGVSEGRVMAVASEMKIRKNPAAKRIWTRDTELPSTWGFGREPGKYTRGVASPKRLPLGAEFVQKRDGTVFVKVAMTGKKNADWRQKNRVEWEKHNGRALIAGEVVAHANGDPHDFTPENLVLRTKADVIEQNNIHNLPREIADLYRAKGQITRAVRRRQKQ